jgi:uncharacterized membrane protein
MATFSVAFSALAVLRHRAFETGRFDLGNMTQAVWSTAQGDLLAVTTLAGEQASRLGSHFDPILVAFAPLWLAWPSPELLLTTQAAAVSLGALPVFWLAAKHTRSERTAVAFAIAYLLYPPVQWIVLDEFHPVALACPLLLFAFWYLDEDRLAAFGIVAGLALLTKEEVGLVVAGLGMWYAFSRGRRLAGATITVAGLGVSILAAELVVPHFAGGDSPFYSRYAAIGGSAGGVLETAFTDPLRILGELSGHDLRYLAELLVPLGGLWLLAPLALLPALPEAALNTLASVPNQSSIRFHYTAALVPSLVAASILGAGRLLRLRPAMGPWVGPGALVLALLANVVPGPPPLQPALSRRVSDHDRAASTALRLIPDGAVVSASNSLGAHLSDRRRILSFPRLRDATWVAVDKERPSYLDRWAPVEAAAALRAVRRMSGWTVAFDRDGIVLLRRTASSP